MKQTSLFWSLGYCKILLCNDVFLNYLRGLQCTQVLFKDLVNHFLGKIVIFKSAVVQGRW